MRFLIRSLKYPIEDRCWSIITETGEINTVQLTAVMDKIAHNTYCLGVLPCDYIYMYAFRRRFYPKRLTVHSGYAFFVSMCVHWESDPQPLRC